MQTTPDKSNIKIHLACENNLKGISLEIPHGKFIVVTGVSGSGKSSLAFDVIAKEGQRRFFETFPTFSRRFLGKLSRPKVESIKNLSAVISISQQTIGGSSRSTVGTISDISDYLRLLFARFGETEELVQLSRSLFSFNSEIGQCPCCKGLGVEEVISIDKLIADPKRTIREGALAPTLPTGYIMYSQVTMDALNSVCLANGFDVDIPWVELTKAQQDVILFGSDKIKVPFGKHSLESRLKWKGIVAKPLEEGFYKGMIPIMSDILRRDRNVNILKYVDAVTCSSCFGEKLNSTARNVRFLGKRFTELEGMELSELKTWFNSFNQIHTEPFFPLIKKITKRIEQLEHVGLSYLKLNRSASTLTGGETQRIRLINQVSAELSNVLYVFDEPSIGLHAKDNLAILKILKQLVAFGNTVLVVEHDELTIRNADWIVDIGPKAGVHGGELLFNGSYIEFINSSFLKGKSPTFDALTAPVEVERPFNRLEKNDKFIVRNCNINNLKGFDVTIQRGVLNVITGLSGAGKSSLANGELKKRWLSGDFRDDFEELIYINQKPIGRTPRSNPATYIGLAERIRDLFSKEKKAKDLGMTKSVFSFNSKGGRCETCEGAGKIQIGMHFLGNVDLVCSSCQGKRFQDLILQVSYQGKNIAEVFELTVEEAIFFFSKEVPILNYLRMLADVGLGYLKLGQPSTTLSGGEAQRIKLANELLKKRKNKTLYIVEEPSVGLHLQDIQSLVFLLKKYVDEGNTIVCIEHDLQIIKAADWIIELGPKSGMNGGELIFQGKLKDLMAHQYSYTAKALRGEYDQKVDIPKSENRCQDILLKGVRTNQLKNIDVAFRRNQLNVVTGISGSGKTSLVFDTLFTESQNRFTESLSVYARSFLKQGASPDFDFSSGLTPVVAINRKSLNKSKRSTVGTLTSILDYYRLFYSRLAQLQQLDYSAQHFSFNDQLGACSVCNGAGVVLHCTENQLLQDAELSIESGCLSRNKRIRFYTDWNGQHIAILKTVAKAHKIDLSKLWNEFTSEEKVILLFGTGEKEWEVIWEYNTKTKSGKQNLKAPWLGFCNYIDEEYYRRIENKNINDLRELLEEIPCSSCQGKRLKESLLAIHFKSLSIFDLGELTIQESLNFFEINDSNHSMENLLLDEIRSYVLPLLKSLIDLGLGYLTINRTSDTLSGGEGQRVRLAGQLAANLVGVTYVLDEPTMGLHATNTKQLIKVIRTLIQRGNTVVLIEHDLSCIEQADHIIELGPGAGNEGGTVLFSGTYTDYKTVFEKLNSHRNQTCLKVPLMNSKPTFEIRKAFKNNLKSIDVEFISKGIISIEGPSGSGKSTLVDGVIVPSFELKKATGCESIFGLDQFEDLVYLKQDVKAISRNNTLLSFLEIYEELQNYFYKATKQTGLKISKHIFSYMHNDGRCKSCFGNGKKRLSMDFTSDVWITCEMCGGKRFNKEALDFSIESYTISDVLSLTVKEMFSVFEISKRFCQALKILVDLGLGHLILGQPGGTFSSGEIQRIQLAKAIIQSGDKNTLYIFDEPSTGLHFQDIDRLIQVFHQLVLDGNTVLFIEHHPQLLAISNQRIQLGPGSGNEGGKLIKTM
jgi:excinuclease ABC subunit A